eukprot:SAG22_NODE_4698_length_1189_cov_1.017431_2_plen_243_part_01
MAVTAVLLPALLWLGRVAEFCGELERHHLEFFGSYTKFLAGLVGVPLGKQLLEPPTFDCPWSFGYKDLHILLRTLTPRRVAAFLIPVLAFGYRLKSPVVNEIKRRQKAKEEAKKLRDRNFTEVVQFSLCSLDEHLVFRQFTLFEMPLVDLVKRSGAMQKAVSKAAEYTTKDYPFMHMLSEQEWTSMRGFIISELSAKFYSGYVARDLGCPIVFDKYFFGFVNEGKGDSTSQKLRVILASEELL